MAEDEIEKIKEASEKQNQQNGLIGKLSVPKKALNKIQASVSRTGRKTKNVMANRKALPFYLVLAAFYVSSFRSANFLFREGMLNEQILAGKLEVLISMINSSFVLGSPVKLLTTVLVLGSVWSIYSYWLKDWKILEESHNLLRKTLLVAIVAVILHRHVAPGTSLAALSEWIVFALTLYIEFAATWFLAKTIDHIDLSSDLKNWSLRLLGLPTVFAGSLISIAAQPFLTTTYTAEIYRNNIFLAGLLLMVIGAFMIYRSTRRQPALKIW